MSEAKLRPCPVCGRNVNTAEWDTCWIVGCSSENHVCEVSRPTEEEAIAAWNDRPAESISVVQRYRYTPMSGMAEDGNGGWLEYSDYVALEAENASLKRQLAAISRAEAEQAKRGEVAG